jgi:hypothetical protein
MIEKCSIGNMSYNIQNITLIILILILIIVIIYYLKNSSTKHNELIEKYTTPSNTDANVNDTNSYSSHNSIATSQLHNFPTSGTEVTLRPCQVQFNNTFDASGAGTHKYVYEDGWQEIATLKETSTSTANRIENKVISANNETNKDDKNGSRDVYTNYSEQSKCFKKISGTDTNNKYRYKNNDLIKYHTDKYVELVELKNGATGPPEQYMQMQFDLGASNSSQYYNNLTESICSLKYADTVSGLSGNLIRLTLNANNIITAINRVTVDATNNHIFNIDTTFDIANLITNGNSGSYRYNQGSQSYEYVTTNSASSGLIVIINLYKFDRNLLCDNTSGTTTYQNIKTYTKLSNAKIDVSKIINFNLSGAETISNTTLPVAYNNNTTIIGDNISKDTLIKNINSLIDSELVEINRTTNTNIATKEIEKTGLQTLRTNFFTANNTKQIFIDNAIIKTNYDDVALKYNVLLNAENYNLKLNEVKYLSQSFNSDSENIKMASADEPVFKELLSAGESDVWETIVYNYAGTDNFRQYEETFPPNTTCKILIVGGGGGGGQFGGGGGGGAILFKANLILDGKYIIKVGKGGKGQEWDNFGKNGEDGQHSSFQKENVASETYVAKGGGGGGTRDANANGVVGNPGGSGGGGSHSNNPTYQASGGVSNKNTYAGWESYGEAGGKGRPNYSGGEPSHASGGGGGAGSVGGDFSNSTGGGNGGAGKDFISTFGTSVGDNGWFGGGGGGNTYNGAGNPGYGNGGKGLFGGGGTGGYDPDTPAYDGIDGTGGGGGGGKWNTANKIKGGNGGSGVVILRYIKKAKIQSDNVSKKITLEYNAKSIRIYNHSGGAETQTPYSFNIENNIKCNILIVAGGGGGGASAGGGGGAGGLIYLTNQDLSAGSYNIKVGKGGNVSAGDGNDSSFGDFVAKGGGGGASMSAADPGTGGSGGGGNRINWWDAGVAGQPGGKGTANQGNDGGAGKNFSGANSAGGGGGGADAAGASAFTAGRGANGGIGRAIDITGTSIYYAGGGGGGSGSDFSVAGTGGLGGGGNGAIWANSGSNGTNGLGGGGGGGSAYPGTGRVGGSGGSGVVIIKIINDSKSYRLRVPKKTNITIVSGGITKTQFLHGIYKITITSTTTTLIKDPSMSLSGIITLNPTGQTEFTSNKIDVIYDFYKSINQINSDNTNTAASIVTNIYTDANTSGITYDYTKYNKYKISTNISKTYINASGGVNFSIYLYSNTGDIINGNNYSIRYVFHVISETDTIVPVDIYLTIKPISTGSSYTRFRVKTYSRSANGTDEAEIYAFIASGSENRNSVSINNFNNITDFNQSLSEQDVWGIVAKQGEITLLNAARVTKDNIGSKCSNGQTTTVKICDVNKLIAIKNAITSAKFTTTSPSFKENISISSSGLFPMSNVSPILNYTIGDYISYESSTQKAPADRITAFNIKDSASKYVYFAIPSAST